MKARETSGDTLRQWRASARLTQSEAGLLLGLSLRQYQRLEASSALVSRTIELLLIEVIKNANFEH